MKHSTNPTLSKQLGSKRLTQHLKLSGLILSLLVLSACQGNEPTPQVSPTTEQHGGTVEGTIEELTVNGITFEVEVIDGKAIFEGDIILGDIDELRASELTSQGVTIDPSCVLIFCDDYKWSNGEIPFVISSSLSSTMRTRVNAAIDHWEDNTEINFITREWYHGDYVEFRSGGVCSSNIGRAGGKQFVDLTSSCSTGAIIHEIGHMVGLFHEHTRCDRDNFVNIRWSRIPENKEHNFRKRCDITTDRGDYDFGSIMHYGPDDFSSNGLPTIECALETCPAFGQRTGLSAGDRRTVNNWY